ncbi:lysozyme inhibitor LprI family protein [Massilia sp. CCM 9210]|uniref:lysozyme inhibitor LprI family protein n=1 Tax=Massilia scottii TaxID=3057166 RepID=UPI0027964E46|nr:lysozyme inhibitor LprI family protein [Massilia sp. CCM 9210]MDQ1813279.1 lysozyme inhibitor LprI family protein [Massilia sp. CCM 9210]
MGCFKKWPQGLANPSGDAALVDCAMRTLARIVRMALVASALVAVPARAADAVRQFDAAEECSEFSQAGIRECLAKKAIDSAASLKKAEARAADAISKWDEDANYIKAARAKLRAAGAAFAGYRQAQCAFATSLAGGAVGNSHEISRLACVADMNAQRAMELVRETHTLAPR